MVAILPDLLYYRQPSARSCSHWFCNRGTNNSSKASLTKPLRQSLTLPHARYLLLIGCPYKRISHHLDSIQSGIHRLINREPSVRVLGHVPIPAFVLVYRTVHVHLP